MKVIATLKAAYPTYYRALSRDEIEAVFRLWEVQFREDVYKDVVMACHSLISSRTNTFPPSIGEIKNALHQTQNPGEITGADAWAMVSKCIARGSVHSREDWERLPDVVKDTISADEIRRLAISEDYNESVQKALFLKAFQTVADRHRMMSVIPGSIAEAIKARREALQAPQSGFTLTDDKNTAEESETPQNAPQPPRTAINIAEYLRKRRETA